jgi:deazaflavin-dependent oxidoreductase (nitroreductase family)
MDPRELNGAVIEAFRAGRDPQGMHRDRLLLLTTKGRHTGRSRTTPMMFHRDGDRLMVIASNAGAAKDPQWYLNLIADPAVVVEWGDERFAAVARPLKGTEKDAAWAQITALYPFFADHQAAVERSIPVVELIRQ